MERAMLHVANCSNIPNLLCEGYVCRTNLPSNTAFRGFGAPQAMMIGETMLSHVAHKLNMDVERVRKPNASTWYEARNRNISFSASKMDFFLDIFRFTKSTFTKAATSRIMVKKCLSAMREGVGMNACRRPTPLSAEITSKDLIGEFCPWRIRIGRINYTDFFIIIYIFYTEITDTWNEGWVSCLPCLALHFRHRSWIKPALLS